MSLSPSPTDLGEVAGGDDPSPCWASIGTKSFRADWLSEQLQVVDLLGVRDLLSGIATLVLALGFLLHFFFFLDSTFTFSGAEVGQKKLTEKPPLVPILQSTLLP